MRILKKSVAFIIISQIFILFSYSQNSSRPVVDMISAKPVSTNKIRITWKLPENFNAEAILVFKDTKPFLMNSKIEGAVPVVQLSPKASAYTDTVINYKEYYYAVIARQADGSLYNIVLPSINATVKGCRVQRPEKKAEPSEEEIEAKKPKVYAEGTLRELPLPYLDVISDLDREPTPLKKEVVEAGKELAKGFENPPKEKLTPYYFEEDIISPAGGDEYFLFEILKTYFVKRDYKGSVTALKNFLSVNRSEETTNRAVFYLGQSQYFRGNYRSALTMFLYVEDIYPVLSKKWINSTLDFYQLPSNY